MWLMSCVFYPAIVSVYTESRLLINMPVSLGLQSRKFVFCCSTIMLSLIQQTYVGVEYPGPKVIKLFSCSAQLRLKFILLINVKMPTIVGIFNIY